MTRKGGRIGENIDRNIEIAELRATGDYTLSDLAQRFGVSRERIRQICNDLGVQHRLKRDLDVSDAIDEISRVLAGC